jgi:F0F1-type ATP synthase membrane subunit b/b'
MPLGGSLMDPLTMLGMWAGALLALITLGTAAWKAFVKAVEAVIATSIGRVWKDMDDIETRLSALELSLQFVREQLEELRRMMQTHIEDK